MMRGLARKKRGLATLAAIALVLAACASARADMSGRFDPEVFFDGRARSHGVIRKALVSVEAFTADFTGRVENGVLVLDERFHFPEGERLQRWRLRPQGRGGYGGTVETEGRSGRLHPPAPVAGTRSSAGVELSYDGFAPGGDARLHFRHRMAMRADGTVLNLVRVTKFGLPIAGARVVFERSTGDGRARTR